MKKNKESELKKSPLIRGEGTLIIVQVDHLTGEQISWAMELLNIPGVKNRNLIPTLTKKGRIGHLVIVDVEPSEEETVGRLLMESLNIFGYHTLKTVHVHTKTVTKKVRVVVQNRDSSIEHEVRLKKSADKTDVAYHLESDDLLALQRRIQKELRENVSLLDLRRRIESLISSSRGDVLHISL
jgi:uncharacterized protein (DUF111 family)